MRERPLWAPWRREYLEGSKNGGCIFCGDDDALLIERGSGCVMLLNAFPYALGHTMIAPTRHVADFEALDGKELLELGGMTQRAICALRAVMSPEGFNVGLNLGAAAGAGIPDHLHMHIVPRWGGDTNFMPVLADTRVVPEALGATCAALRAALEPSA